MVNINKSTVGYDQNNFDAMLKTVRANVVKKASDSLESGLKQLQSKVSLCWTGKSADIFKKNMADDVAAICDALDKSYNIFKNEATTVMNKMGQVDQDLVKRYK